MQAEKGGDSSEDDADDFLKVKKRDRSDSQSDGEASVEETKSGAKKGGKKEMKLVTDTELLARYYGENEEELDANERFLRSYILNEGWKEKAGKTVASTTAVQESQAPLPGQLNTEAADAEDEQRADEMENFEREYNFRFEEPNAATIVSHARNVNAEETMRRKESSRKLARQRAQERKEELKQQRKDEIAKLKELKRVEIIEKLQKADYLAKGNLFKDKSLVERV